jgi:hypothetical protein
MLLRLPALDEVLSFLDGADLVRLGGAGREAREAVGRRLDALAAFGPTWEQPQARSLVCALSRDIVLRLAAESVREDRLDDATTRRVNVKGRWLRVRFGARNPRANLLAEHRRLLGIPLIYGTQTWHAATHFLGFEPFSGQEWWVRPGLLPVVAIALLDSHCAFCGVHLTADVAEDVIYHYGAPQNVRQVCGTCNRIQQTHHARFVKNHAVRSARMARRVWKSCTQDNPECYQWHHASQDRCECICHGDGMRF